MTTKNYNRFFLSLLRQLKRASEQGQDMAHVARTELLKPTEPTVIWPSDTTFRNGWLSYNRILTGGKKLLADGVLVQVFAVR